jgi:hypothetical protein
MRFEIFLFLVTGAIIAHIYSDGAFFKRLMSYKKYYQIGGVIFGAFFIYWLIKKSPDRAKELILNGNEYIKYLPVDRNVSSFIEPLIDFTAKQSFAGDGYSQPVISKGGGQIATEGRFKRSVSDSKKKYIASKQGWKCRECSELLPATFEVDHIKRLQHGGTNDIDNLQALCPNCHRNKTMLETMSV